MTIALGIIAGLCLLAWLFNNAPPAHLTCPHKLLFTLCPHCKPTGVYKCPPTNF